WSALDHPNVLRFLGTSLDLALSPALITPFYGSGSIMKYLTGTPRSSQERLGFVQGIARGLAYHHSQSIVHGNLTTVKFLVSDAGLPVICGYGLASISSHLAKNTTTSSSKRFTAPEYLVDESTRRTTPGDVYSFSMVLLEVMSGVRPYDNIPHELNVVFHVLPGGRPSRSDNPRFVTDHFWRFLEGLWHHQPTLRPEMDHVILMLQSL
ncbi:kinase-like domain-containing protein, partial [Mycena alexandri]